MSLTTPSSSTAHVPASMALGMTTTIVTLREEQKRTELVVRQALSKAQETCLALTAEIATLKAEIKVLESRLTASEHLYSATLRARDAQIAALTAQIEAFKSQVRELKDEAAAEKEKKDAIIATIKFEYNTDLYSRIFMKRIINAHESFFSE